MKGTAGRSISTSLSVLVALMLWVSTSLLYSQQTTAELVGVVQDSSGATISGAQLTLRNEQTNITREIKTSAEGLYVFTSLVPGKYTLDVESQGFKKKRFEGVFLTVAQRTRLEVTLDIGQLAETVTVEADIAFVDTETPTIGTTLSHDAIVRLPLNGRDFTQLVTLSPGVASTPEGVTGGGVPSPGNNIGLDGGSARDPFNGATALTPILDSIQEFRVQVSQYSAEYGGGGGLMIDAATRSGNNALHGSLWEFHRNVVLDAPTFFSPIDSTTGEKIKGPLIRNQFGFVVGGPVVKNRTFFFGAYEGLRLPNSTTYTGRIPTAQERAGDLFQYALQSNKHIIDPLSGQPFANDVIPGSRIDPIGANIANNLFEDPNTNDPYRNWMKAQKAGNNQNNWSLRLDHTLSDQQCPVWPLQQRRYYASENRGYVKRHGSWLREL